MPNHFKFCVSHFLFNTAIRTSRCLNAVLYNLCQKRFESRNCVRQGKASEGDEAVFTYGDSTESMPQRSITQFMPQREENKNDRRSPAVIFIAEE